MARTGLVAGAGDEELAAEVARARVGALVHRHGGRLDVVRLVVRRALAARLAQLVRSVRGGLRLRARVACAVGACGWAILEQGGFGRLRLDAPASVATLVADPVEALPRGRAAVALDAARRLPVWVIGALLLATVNEDAC